MNLIEYILIHKHRCNILISGYIWTDIVMEFAKTLATNFDFELINVKLTKEDKIITNINEINFNDLNNFMIEKKNENKNSSNPKGYIIVGYTFPTELLKFDVNYHINISFDTSILESEILKYIKIYDTKRLDIDNHINFITRNWNFNHFNKKIILSKNYLNDINNQYGDIFNAIIIYFAQKIFGDDYKNYINTDEKDINNTKDEKKKYYSNKDIEPVYESTRISDNINNGQTNAILDYMADSDNDLKEDEELLNIPELTGGVYVNILDMLKN